MGSPTFPLLCRFRNLLGSISSSFNLTHTFLVIKLFTNLETLVGLEGVFWIYAFFSLVGAAFVAAVLPETKGKTLEEIEAHFRKQGKEKEAAGTPEEDGESSVA